MPACGVKDWDCIELLEAPFAEVFPSHPENCPRSSCAASTSPPSSISIHENLVNDPGLPFPRVVVDIGLRDLGTVVPVGEENLQALFRTGRGRESPRGSNLVLLFVESATIPGLAISGAVLLDEIGAGIDIVEADLGMRDGVRNVFSMQSH